MNQEQFNIYKKYYGDGDMFIRTGNKPEKALMKEFDWHSFGGLLQDLYIISQNKASREFKESTFEKLNEIAPDNELRQSVLEYAKMLNEIQSEYLSFLKKFVK